MTTTNATRMKERTGARPAGPPRLAASLCGVGHFPSRNRRGARRVAALNAHPGTTAGPGYGASDFSAPAAPRPVVCGGP
jgi:hypothetical protein